MYKQSRHILKHVTNDAQTTCKYSILHKGHEHLQSQYLGGIL